MDTITVRYPYESDRLVAMRELDRRLSVEFDAVGDRCVHCPHARVYASSADASDDGEAGFFVFLDYSSVDDAKLVLSVIAGDATVFIDFDFDLTMYGHEFLARCKATPNWSWR